MNKNYYWPIAIIVGSLINIGLFLFLPSIGQTAQPKPPQVIELEFMAWQQPIKKQTKQIIKPPSKPKEKPKPKQIKPKPKPQPKATPKPKITPKPKPVLSEKVIPKKIVTPIKKPDIVEVIEPPPPRAPALEKATVTDEALPTPEPIFKLTSLPRMIHRQTPVYPLAMKHEGKEATVKLEVLLDVKGNVRKVTIKKSGGTEFDQAAIVAIKNSTFMPANINGKPVAVLMKIPVKFRLR